MLNEEIVKLTRNSGLKTCSAPTFSGPNEAIFVTKSINPNIFSLRVKIVSKNKIK